MDKVNDRWTVLPASTAGCSYIKNVGRNQYLEWYADKNNWSAYGSLNNEALFAHQFYLLKEGTAPEPTDPILVASVSLDRESAALEEGKTIQLTAEVLPENADDKSLTWASDDEDVATVDQSGLVTAVAEGTATITVTTNDGSDLSAACTVTVTKADTPVDPEEPEEIEEGLITDLSQLKDGSKVVIYNQNNDLAMTSETYRDWYLLGSAVTIEDDKVVSPADNLIWEVTVNDNGTYTFKQGDKTVGTWLSGTYVELTSNASQSGLDNEWILTECNSSSHKYYMNTALEGSYGPIYLEVYSKSVNGSNQLVFCGYSTKTKMTEKDFGMQFYLVEDAYSVTVEETEHGTVTVSDDRVKEGETVTITAIPDDGYVLESLLINGVEQTVDASGVLVYTVTENIVIKATFVERTGLVTDLSQLKDGSKVVVYNPYHAKAMTSDVLGQDWYLASADVTIEDEKIVDPIGKLVWEVSIDNGVYTFSQGEKKLTAWLNGSYVEITSNASHSGAATGWNLEEYSSSNHTYLVTSSTLSTSYGPVFLETYSKNVNGSSQLVFCGYSTTKTSNKFNGNDYPMQFYLVADDGDEPEPTGDSFGYNTHLETGDKIIIYSSEAQRGVTSNLKGNYYADGYQLTPVEGVITTDETSVVWDVTVNSDGTYTFTQGSKTLGGVQTTNASTGRIYNNIVFTNPPASKWTTERSGNGFNLYLGELPSSKTNGHIYLEWSSYNGNNQFQLYDYENPSSNVNFVYSFYKLGAEPEDPEEPVDPGDLITSLEDLDGATVAIYSPGHKTAASSKPNGDWYLKAQNATVIDNKMYNYTKDMVWDVKYEDGFYHFYAAYPEDEDHTEIAVWQSGDYMELTVNPYYDADTLSEWTIRECSANNHTWYIVNPALTNDEGVECYIEAYERNKTEVFSGYCPRANTSDNELALQFIRVDKETALDDYDGVPTGILEDGKQYVIYNSDSKRSLGLYREANFAFDAIPTQIVGSKAKPGNGAYVFTVHTIGRYYAFEVNGKYLATNDKEELFFMDANPDGSISNSAKWYLTDLNGWWLIFNKIHHYGGQPVCIEYFSSVFSGWTYKYKKPPENVDPIYEFKFYEVTDDTIVIDDIVQDPSVRFDCNDSRHLEEDYKADIK
ncbi:MAG: Ig-like domain-containing protein, partial [Erysipelotrichaceae bacterium]|nr:Ig-like domain-containing protein [Erysipelotrichaceae bacterium]